MTDTMHVQGEIAPAQSPMAASIEAPVSPTTAAPALPAGFIELGLAPELVQAVADLGYTEPTQVQTRAIPLAMGSGDDASFIDLMVSSQTGSGKTAAFLLPVLHTLIRQQAEAEVAERAAFERAAAEAAARGEAPPKRPKRKNPTQARNFKAATPGALVLCPTRELAQQVAHDAIDLVKHCKGLRIANVVGGMPYQLQIAKLQNANLVVATPGRLLDLQRSQQIKLDQVQFLVVDEADRMLDLGFSDDLAEINQLTAQRKQTMMFSATFAPRIQQLAMRVMHDNGASVKKIQIDTPQEKHANIKQMLYWADNAQHKRKLLDHWLRDASIDQAIVFASTQVECDGLANDLQQEGFSAVALHGALSQGLRNRRLMALRNGQVQILVATDVAARGIDVPTITHVFNFGLPMKAEDYTHRIGRTGRAGRDGLAVTFAEFRDRRKIFDIEGYSRQQFKAEVVAGLEPTQRFPQGGRADFGGRGGRDGHRGPREQRFGRGGSERGFGDRGGYGDRDPRGSYGDRGGFADRGPRGAAPRSGEGYGAPRGGDRGNSFGGRRDGEGYGRKSGFGEASRFGDAGRHGGGRGDAAVPRADFGRKPAFAKPQGAGKPFVPHGAGKRPARNDR
ncbi:DEAD/DEAH box helicase [Diaphorobacter sp. ED-3]|uniref:DEAD/DEAH box helicase n=1 Tax=Diaphorobacter sp. ED-3 TaxID=3016636 RepID=UPI0022DCE6FE|nr:DEAD/DEAH box helicase [Diaphorobacter sp. ED-3]